MIPAATLRTFYRLVIAALAIAAASGAAAEGFESYSIDELYSNADGTVQYVVLRETQAQDGQNLFAGHALTMTGAGGLGAFTFPANLPSAQTASRRVLIATRGFASLGVVAPDYLMPDRFLATDGGTLDYAGVDSFNFATLPGDGTNARYRSGTVAPNVATNFIGLTGIAPPLPVSAIEYYHTALDHYFLSPLAADIDALDSGRTAGWARTGYSFPVLPAAAGSAAPVCRYYIPPAHGNSHFLSASVAECAAIAAKIPVDPNFSGYVLETPAAFYVQLPDAASGACPAGTIAVYRLWNARADSNHRYASDTTVRDRMLARNYVAEGYGPDAVAMCAPQATTSQRVTPDSGFAPGCDRVAATGALYVNGEVEPFVAVNPRNPANVIGIWQQDRWSNGGARGLVAAASFDGGQSFAISTAPLSRCTGGSAANGADYARISDPWVSFAADGTAYMAGLAFNGAERMPGSSSAVLVSRSTDGGRTWSNATTLIRDGSAFFNDKDSITADRFDARYAYATWDRLDSNDRGPTWFARTIDGGLSWEPARMIYDPGEGAQTINNQIAVAYDGTLVLLLTALNVAGDNLGLFVLRSSDHGASWSAAILVSDVHAIGASLPGTAAMIRDGINLGSIAAGPDGMVAAVWQDARFNGGARDQVAFSLSRDSGLTWSAPVRVNAVATTQAFLPAVAIRDDGTIGVLYYDMRNLGGVNQSAPTDAWLASSGDGLTWSDSHVAGPFDFAFAPSAGGAFLGDYQALASIGTTFLPFFARANADLNNRSDVVAALASRARVASVTARKVESDPGFVATPEFAKRVAEGVRRTIASRRRGNE